MTVSKPYDYQGMLTRATEASQMFTPRVSSRLGNTLEKEAIKIKSVTNLLKNLMADDGSNFIGRAEGLLKARFQTLEKARMATFLELETRLSEAEKLGGALHAARKLVKDMLATAQKTTEQSSHFLSRWASNALEGHNHWIDSRTSHTRMGIAIGEIALGSIIMDIGGRFLGQAISGLRETSLQQKYEPGPGGKGSSTTTVMVMMPMSTSERLIKSILGAGGVAAGLGGNILGIYTLFR